MSSIGRDIWKCQKLGGCRGSTLSQQLGKTKNHAANLLPFLAIYESTFLSPESKVIMSAWEDRLTNEAVRFRNAKSRQ